MDFNELLRALLPVVAGLIVLTACAVFLAALGPALLPLACLVAVGLLVWFLLLK